MLPLKLSGKFLVRLLNFISFHGVLFRLSKSEIKHIMDCPFAMLNRREVGIRKLLNKYHDDAEFMKRSTAAVALGFDHHRAERVRAKNTRFYSKEEIEWSSVDRILHPEVNIRTCFYDLRYLNAL